MYKGLKPSHTEEQGILTRYYTLVGLVSLIHSDSNINYYQKLLLESKTRPERKTDNLTAICEPIVCKM
jgi:hypothetical protein